MNTATARAIWRDVLDCIEANYPDVFNLIRINGDADRYRFDQEIIDIIMKVANE